MSENASEQQYHKKFAIDLFNYTWSLLDKPDRTPEDDDQMVHAAHASRFHWSKVGTAVHLARGEWQISRVYAVLKRPERCLQICEANSIGDFDLAFAYEALARACAVAGKVKVSQQYVEKAKTASAQIKDEEDRALVLTDLETI